MTAVRDLLISELHIECDDLRAENERLRAALKTVLRGYETAVRKAWEPMHPGADEHLEKIREAYKLAEGDVE